MIGLSCVGLPLAELFASKGFPVLSLDIDVTKTERLQAGQSYIGHIPPQRGAELRKSGRFEASSNFALLVQADALLICVPTPLGAHREPDLSAVVNTALTISQYLRSRQLSTRSRFSFTCLREL